MVQGITHNLYETYKGEIEFFWQFNKKKLLIGVNYIHLLCLKYVLSKLPDNI